MSVRIYLSSLLCLSVYFAFVIRKIPFVTEIIKKGNLESKAAVDEDLISSVLWSCEYVCNKKVHPERNEKTTSAFSFSDLQ